MVAFTTVEALLEYEVSAKMQSQALLTPIGLRMPWDTNGEVAWGLLRTVSNYPKFRGAFALTLHSMTCKTQWQNRQL